MLINVEWLNDWVEIAGGTARLAEDLTNAGLEVDAVTPVAPDLAGIVVARIQDLHPHPRAERLTVCAVDDGRGVHTVVCGAPNVVVGLRVPYAPVGARLPAARAVGAVDFRGVVSEGMLCSARELGLGEEGSGLMALADDAPVGAPLEAYLRLDDAVLEVNITPNRGDCFSVLGIAREIAAVRKQRLRRVALAPIAPASERIFPVRLAAPAACPRFAGRVVEDLRTGVRSPDWLCERLRRAGLRAIHPVVDVTNYVMLELGQPLHAYSLDALSEGITVRFAAPGEGLALLDGKRIELAEDVLVIADAAGPVGLAGIMGGARTGVTAATRSVFFEAAFFAPDAILGRARRYGLHTDASLRFERGVDPTQQQRAIERATELLQSIAGGHAGPTQLVEGSANLPTRAPIELRAGAIEAMLGLPVAAREVEEILARLQMRVAPRGQGWSVVPPAFRFDLAIEADLIEELARLVGYDNIPAVTGVGSGVLGQASERRINDSAIADTLVARGYSEAITYSFIDLESEELINPGAQPVRLANPISAEMSVMRRSLWPGLLRVAQQNMTRQQVRPRLFEIGRQFAERAGQTEETRVVAGLAAGEQWPEHWDMERRLVDFFDLKGDLECLLELTGRKSEFEFVADVHPALIPTQTARIRSGTDTVGWLGAAHPRVQKHFDLKSAVVLFSLQIDKIFPARVTSYSHFSKFPSVRRDLAVVIDEGIPVSTLLRHAQTAGGGLLQSVRVFDLYRGPGIDSRRKSVALGLILQDASRTLTDDDADRTVDTILRRLEHELGATIRT
jgi:phenylalanyl-tRNA synthetase beta chain